MKNKVKIVMLMFFLIILSACNTTYNIELNKDKSSKETITINDFNNYYNNNEIDDLMKEFFPNLDNLTYEIKNNNLIINRLYSNYYDLSNNYTIDKQFGTLKIDFNKISFKPNYDKCLFLFLDGTDYDENGKKYINNDKLEINLTIPFKVKNSNADKINDKTYTWTYNINSCTKELFIEFNDSNIKNYILLFIGTIIIIVCIIIIKKRKLNQN